MLSKLWGNTGPSTNRFNRFIFQRTWWNIFRKFKYNTNYSCRHISATETHDYYLESYGAKETILIRKLSCPELYGFPSTCFLMFAKREKSNGTHQWVHPCLGYLQRDTAPSKWTHDSKFHDFWIPYDLFAFFTCYYFQLMRYSRAKKKKKCPFNGRWGPL